MIKVKQNNYTAFIVVIMPFFINSCINNSRIITTYKEGIHNFEVQFIDFFPKKPKNKLIYLSSISPKLNPKLFDIYGNKGSHLYAFFQVSNENIKKIIDKKFIDYKIYSYEDSALIKIPYVGGSEKNRNNLKVIPNLDNLNYKTEPFIKGIPFDFKIIIIEHKNGKYLSIHQLITDDALPPNITHGYCKGIGYSYKNDFILYWVIIW